MKRKNISIVLNIIIIVLEILGIIHNLRFNGRFALEYYTEQSNVLLLISSILMLIYNDKKPNWLKDFKYLTTVDVSITFFVALFILLPMTNYNFKEMFFVGTLLYHHFLCPILAMITFVFFDDLKDFDKKDTLISLIHTGIYAFVMIILNILRVYEGPYPFLMVYNQGVLISLLWVVIIFTTAYTISYILRTLKKKVRY